VTDTGRSRTDRRCRAKRQSPHGIGTRDDVDRGLGHLTPAETVTEANLAHLPAPAQRYLRAAGVLGQPRVRNFHVRVHERIRGGRDARWMPLTAEQYNFVDDPARFFYVNASMFAIPVQGYHRFVGLSATMKVKAAALITVADASGAEMDQAETVTLFNDMCVMAPAVLINPLTGYRSFGRVRLSLAGEGRWHEPEGEYAYIDLILDDISYNVRAR
jgi:uncharacterized protein DUF6544